MAMGTHTQPSSPAFLAYIISVASLLPRHLGLLLDLQKLMSPEKTESLHSMNSRSPMDHSPLGTSSSIPQTF